MLAETLPVDPQRVIKSLTFTFTLLSPKCEGPLAAEKCLAGIFAVSALPAAPTAGEVRTLDLGGGVTMELVRIPPGEFMLGSTKEEQAWALANGATEGWLKRGGEAQCKATIRQGFSLGRTEVTVGQWKQFVKETN